MKPHKPVPMILMLAIMLTLLPVLAFRASALTPEEADVTLYFDNESPSDSGPGWTYDQGKHLLTLNGYKGRGILFAKDLLDSITVQVEGSNTVTVDQPTYQTDKGVPVFYYGGIMCFTSMTVQGSGSLHLSVTNSDSHPGAVVYLSGLGNPIYDTINYQNLKVQGDVSVQAELDIQAKQQQTTYAAGLVSTSSLEVSSKGAVTVTASTAAQTDNILTGMYACGVNLDQCGKITLTNCGINAISDGSPGSKKLTLNGVTAEISSGGFPCMLASEVQISSSTVNLTSGVLSAGQAVIYSEERGITIADSKVKVTSPVAAIGITTQLKTGKLNITGKTQAELVRTTTGPVIQTKSNKADNTVINQIALESDGFVKLQAPSGELIDGYVHMSDHSQLSGGSVDRSRAFSRDTVGYMGMTADIGGEPVWIRYTPEPLPAREVPSCSFQALESDSNESPGLITGLQAGMLYQVGSNPWQTAKGSSAELKHLRECIITIKNPGGDGKSWDGVQQLKVEQMPEPKGISTIDVTAYPYNGKLTGVTSKLQYQRPDKTDYWYTCEDGEIRYLSPGLYSVRTKASGSKLPSWGVKLELVAIGAHSIQVTDGATFHFGDASKAIDFAWPGNKILLIPNSGGSGKCFDHWNVKQGTVQLEPLTPEEGRYAFQMPDEDVKIEQVFSEYSEFEFVNFSNGRAPNKVGQNSGAWLYPSHDITMEMKPVLQKRRENEEFEDIGETVTPSLIHGGQLNLIKIPKESTEGRVYYRMAVSHNGKTYYSQEIFKDWILDPFEGDPVLPRGAVGLPYGLGDKGVNIYHGAMGKFNLNGHAGFPDGLSLTNTTLTGCPTTPGTYKFNCQVIIYEVRYPDGEIPAAYSREYTLEVTAETSVLTYKTNLAHASGLSLSQDGYQLPELNVDGSCKITVPKGSRLTLEPVLRDQTYAFSDWRGNAVDPSQKYNLAAALDMTDNAIVTAHYLPAITRAAAVVSAPVVGGRLNRQPIRPAADTGYKFMPTASWIDIWEENGEEQRRIMDSGDVFQAGHRYQVSVTIFVAKSGGYGISDSLEMRINGVPASRLNQIENSQYNQKCEYTVTLDAVEHWGAVTAVDAQGVTAELAAGFGDRLAVAGYDGQGRMIASGTAVRDPFADSPRVRIPCTGMERAERVRLMILNDGTWTPYYSPEDWHP